MILAARRSVRRKQMLILMLASTITLLLACLALVGVTMLHFRTGLADEISSMAKIAGTSSTAALQSNDSQAAAAILAALRQEPPIAHACLYNRRGELFATYHRDTEAIPFSFPAVQPPGEEFRAGQLHVFLPIVRAGEPLGTIYVACDLYELNDQLLYSALSGLLVLGISLGVAFLLSLRLQRVVANPVMNLVQTVQTVVQEKNFSVRATRQNEDEIGLLVDGFNQMLEQIQQRDAELLAAREQLERRVEARTAELAESLSVLNAALDSTADGILVVNAQGRKIFQNRQVADLWKFPPEIAGDPENAGQFQYAVSQVVDPAPILAAAEYFSAHPTERGELEVELKNGTILYRITAPVLGQDGRSYGRLWLFRDVTESRRQEIALRESQARFKFIFDSVPVGIASHLVHADGRITRVINEAHLRICGLTREQHDLPDIYAKLIHPEDFVRQSEYMRRVMAGEISHYAMEKRYIRLDGRQVWVAFSYQRTHYAAGSFEELTTVVDITESKQAEAELAYERDLLRTLLDNAPDHIYFKDAQSRFIKTSQALARHSGLVSADELVGKSDFDFFTDDQAQQTLADEQEIMRTGQPIVGKIEKESWRDGPRESWSLTTKMPLRNKAGEIIGTFGISKDITAIIKAEARLKEVHQQLLETSRQAGMAEVATNVLHNVGNVLNSVNVSTSLVLDQIKQSKVVNLGRAVALLNQSGDHLAAFLTTDPKGRQLPGYLIQLAGQLAQDQAMVANELGLLRQHIDHIKDIVVMQQSYAKISGVTEIVSVSDLVEDALRMNAGALSRHQVKIVRDYASLATITVEKHRVLQILVNLIRNAKYACDDSGRADKELTLRVRPVEQGVQIAIIDNGVGIPPENLTRIFSHGFTTRKEGHGFGLHSGALAAKELGGTLTVASAGTGQGAEFILTLPLQPLPSEG